MKKRAKTIPLPGNGYPVEHGDECQEEWENQGSYYNGL